MFDKDVAARRLRVLNLGSVETRDTPHPLKRKGTAPTVPYPEVVTNNESILASAPTLAMEPPAMEDLVSA